MPRASCKIIVSVACRLIADHGGVKSYIIGAIISHIASSCCFRPSTCIVSVHLRRGQLQWFGIEGHMAHVHTNYPQGRLVMLCNVISLPISQSQSSAQAISSCPSFQTPFAPPLCPAPPCLFGARPALNSSKRPLKVPTVKPPGVLKAAC